VFLRVVPENDSKIACGLQKSNTINECRCLVLKLSLITVEKHTRIMEEKVLEKPRVADHLANERTFLAWIRTSIGIMGFGFVVVKFSLFTREISVALGAARKMPQPGYSHVIGIMLVALGGLVIVFSYFRYLSTQKQIDRGVYYHSDFFAKTTTIAIFMICMVLLIYLLQTR
jgi:putative membrane protein